ncbi:hypothetical protein ACFPN0_02105 [Kitasatospora cinereorecta]
MPTPTEPRQSMPLMSPTSRDGSWAFTSSAIPARSYCRGMAARRPAGVQRWCSGWFVRSRPWCSGGGESPGDTFWKCADNSLAACATSPI